MLSGVAEGCRRSSLRWPFAWSALLLMALAPNVQAEGLFGRGDADCSETIGAADTIATVRALAGPSVCGNDDCNRDGVVTSVDADCAIDCLFGDCRIPLNAPQVTSVETETGDAIRPYATIHVFGTNFGTDDRRKRVTIDAEEAEVLAIADSDELIVLVPPTAAGAAELRVYDGDLGGLPFLITVAAQTAIGAPDSFDATLDLLDTVTARFAELDLESHYGADAAIVRVALASFRDQLEQQRAALADDPGFTSALRAELDAAFDSSGVPDRLRAILADIDQLLAASQAPPRFNPRDATLVVAAIANNLAATIAVGRGVVAIGAGGLSATAAGIALGAGVLAGTLTLVASAALPPIVSSMEFFLAGGQPAGGPGPNRVVVVRGARLLGTHLVIQAARGHFEVEAEGDTDTTRQFRLPNDAIGFCGRVILYLARRFPLAGESGRVADIICPKLSGIGGPNPVAPGEQLQLDAHSMSGCDGKIRFDGSISNESAASHGLSPILVQVGVPNLEAGTYMLTPEVERCQGPPLPGLMVRDAVTGLEVVCSPTGPETHTSNLEVPPGAQDRTTCHADLLPHGVTRPLESQLEWRSSDARTADFIGTNVGDTISLGAKLPGTTEISAELIIGQRTIATSGALSQKLVVRDSKAPAVVLTSSSPATVAGGTSIPVHVSATDNVVVSRIRLVAEGPVGNAEQEFPCIDLEKSCSTDLSVNVDASATQGTVTIIAEAVDGFGNMGTSAQLSFTVTPAPDTTCPELTIQSPPDGGVVNAGAMVAVVAHATDAVGVKRFRYSAMGEALVTPVMQELPFPTALMSAELHFTFTLKSVAALASISNRTVTITIEALDEAGNSCGTQTNTVSVGGLWEDCEGSISADIPVGHSGEMFTVTAIVTGALATRVNEVLSHNPGGTFDLTPRGNGVFSLTLTYQGVGKFKLGFTALDHGDPVCEGSIGLEAIAAGGG